MMVTRRFSSLFTILVFGALLLAALPAQGQWSILKTFPSGISSVYFLDQQGSATTGFVGLQNSTIWRTVDNGVTWNRVTTPSSVEPLEITQFAFRNALQGWCSVEGYLLGTLGAIWETTDGGQTWNSIEAVVGDVVAIGFCSTTNELVAPCWNTKSICSSDFGVTWTQFAPQQQNGVTFSGNVGFIGLFNTLLTTLYSTDGGLTWNNAASLVAETWSPYALQGTSTVVAAAEKTHQFFLSTNGGANWTNPYTFTPIPTGCIMGTAANLFVQTSDGFYSSTDLGNSWNSICGPSNFRDNRFYSMGTQIFAGDENTNANLWYIPNALVGITLHLDKTSINFSGTLCATSDSLIHITTIGTCKEAILSNAQILSGSPEFSLGDIQLPYELRWNDNISVLYSPSMSLKDSGKLLLQFALGTDTVDTIITLHGTASSATYFNISITPSLDLSIPYACMTEDSTLIVRNLACDSLTVISASLSDSTHFQILSLALPHVIAPGNADTIHIASSSLHDGTFTAELALRMLGGGIVPLSDSVPLTLKVAQAGHAEIGQVSLTVLDACTPIDTQVTISATPCDSIVLLDATLSDTTVFQLGAMSFPVVIPASGNVNIAVHVSPGRQGTYSTQLHLRYLSGSVTVDTTIVPTLQVLYDLPVQVGLQDTVFNMGVVSVPCSSSSQWITFSNSICQNLSIENVGWESVDSAFSLDPTAFPIILLRDSGRDSILVHFKPNTSDTASNRLRVTLNLGGVVVDTFITISGIGISSFHDTLLTQALNYDTVIACQSKELVGKVINLSCDSIVATSAIFSNGINYNVISPIFPVTLAPDSTLQVLIQLQPEQNANVTDSMRITILDPLDGSDHIETIALAGYVIPSSHALALSSARFSLANIPPCSTEDSTIVLTNNGNCDDIIVNDTSLAGHPGVTFILPSSLPLTIPPDSSIRIAFHVAPNADTVVSTQFILHGQNIDTTIAFGYASLPGGNALAFSAPDSVFTTRPCTPVTKTFWIANVGCYPTALDTIALNALPNETQFSFGSLPAFPTLLPPGDTLYYTLQFDPNGSGNGVATLNVRANQANYNRSIRLNGSAVGIIPTARISLEASDHTTQSTGYASDTTGIAAVLLDDIGDTTNLQTVLFTLDANWNLLTLTKIIPAAGWSIADTATENNGSLDIRLRHDGGGAVAAGTELVQCYFYIAVTDSASSDITMSNLRFNDSSATYDGCVLSSIEMQGDVPFTMIDTCGTPLLRGLLEGQVALEIISVRPNPVSLMGGAAKMELCFALAKAGTVTISLTDMLGRTIWQTSIPCTAGTQTLPLELPSVPEGNCFIEVSSAGVKDSRKVAFESGFGKN